MKRMIFGALILLFAPAMLINWVSPIIPFAIGGILIIWGAKSHSSKKISVSKLEADIIKARRSEDFD